MIKKTPVLLLFPVRLVLLAKLTGPDKRRSREDIEGGDLNNFELGGGDDLEMEMNMDGADGGVDFAGEGDELNLYNLPQDRQV